MIKKKFRLSTKEIKDFFEQKSVKINDHNLKILYQKNNLGYPKFAVVCKKNIFRTTVIRNKIRRRLYSIIYQLIKSNQLKNLNFIIIPQSQEIINDKFSTLKIKLKSILHELMV